MKKLPSHFSISPDVKSALGSRSPIVALETAVITHGLPRPQNLELAHALESTAISLDVTPATVGVIRGKIHVGLGPSELQFLAKSENLRKISRRDFSIAISTGASGGTTVAGTLFAANAIGIRVFATGGIGGVHRDSTFDMSADLPELARTPMVVVCSGAKAILDLPATLETLETMGVPVIGYQTDEFPAFYSAQSGLRVDCRVDFAEEIANIYKSHLELNMESALLVVVPPPKESAVPKEILEIAIGTALAESESLEIHGAAITPFLLRRVNELTHGESLRSNLALLLNNLRIACEIAKVL
jgi:pseudouridine-5'-phosphate glycosidase